MIVRNEGPDDQQLIRLKESLDSQKNELGILGNVPGISDLTILFDPGKTSFEELQETILKTRLDEELKKKNNCLLKIPVCYDSEFAPNLELIASQIGMKTDQLIEYHTAERYRILMMGFLPGFPYMKTNHKKLSIKRLDTPIKSINTGSIGLADEMCGIYPSQSPGGWNIIGRTPLNLIRKNEVFPFLFKAGYEVQFYAINKEEFEAISTKELVGDYNISQHLENS